MRATEREYYTVDGRRPAPHPGMTDDDLWEFEHHFGLIGVRHEDQ